MTDTNIAYAMDLDPVTPLTILTSEWIQGKD
jgi:hypothetical protein